MPEEKRYGDGIDFLQVGAEAALLAPLRHEVMSRLRAEKREAIDVISNEKPGELVTTINKTLAELRNAIIKAYDKEKEKLDEVGLKTALKEAFTSLSVPLVKAYADKDPREVAITALQLVSIEAAIALKEKVPNQDRGAGRG